MPRQTVQAKIRLLQNQGLHNMPFHLHFLDTLHGKTEQFLLYTEIHSDVSILQILMIFTLVTDIPRQTVCPPNCAGQDQTAPKGAV